MGAADEAVAQSAEPGDVVAADEALAKSVGWWCSPH
jgi:uncharacterized protein YaiI (UPF0178 family)